ncbi:MAG: hypothetical protein GY862_27800 [Gammaproteobacteria bacterium]|nr:hypothetical protein [Gammaproteobacteria bacterium]
MKCFLYLVCLGLSFGGMSCVGALEADNATWTVYTSRKSIQSLALSADGAVLWAGSEGGLEQRDAHSGRILRVYTHLDGLPDNSLAALLPDADGGLWAGTSRGDLARLDPAGHWTVYIIQNSGSPDNEVRALYEDEQGNLWIGTFKGLVQLDKNGSWWVYGTHNGLPNNEIGALQGDGAGGLWIGSSRGGLVYRSADGGFTVFGLWTN